VCVPVVAVAALFLVVAVTALFLVVAVAALFLVVAVAALFLVVATALLPCAAFLFIAAAVGAAEAALERTALLRVTV
jgi:hypothetical protein